ncbi:MAG: hypothetical protein JSU66_08030 [Deltaproteobacteria bacterium]|nr:MAG: hypothetical protein JSU66_08030 [Deltaproteobacteria bacterium]
MSGPFGSSIEEDLKLLDVRLKQLKLEYEQYFLGNRPTEPQMQRAEVQKIITFWSGQPIRNTALRFRFNTICARFFSLRRQWGEIVRRIEEGTYERHVFKAKLHERERGAAPKTRSGRGKRGAGDDDVFQQLVDARMACGQGVEGMTREKVSALLRKQADQIRKKHGDGKVQFRVVVEQGKAKLKASRVREG